MSERNFDKLDALLRHTLRHAEIPQPPANFAREVARQIDDLPEQATIEAVIAHLVLAIACTAVVAFTLSQVRIARVLELLDGAPWPLLLTAAAICGTVKLLESIRDRPQSRPTDLHRRSSSRR